MKLSEISKQTLINELCGYIRKNHGDDFVNDPIVFDSVATLLAEHDDMIIGFNLRQDLETCAVRISPLALWKAVCHGEFHGDRGCTVSPDLFDNARYIFRSGFDWSGLEVFNSNDGLARETAYAVESLILRTGDRERFLDLLSEMSFLICEMGRKHGIDIEDDL